MPYKMNSDLPDSVRNAMPAAAQTIFREVYNKVWDEYKDPERRREHESHEEVANKVAWNAVKKQFEKDEDSDKWKPCRLAQ
jgi:cation transport regulator